MSILEAMWRVGAAQQQHDRLKVDTVLTSLDCESNLNLAEP